MTVDSAERTPIPVTCFTGFLGKLSPIIFLHVVKLRRIRCGTWDGLTSAPCIDYKGKTTTILSVLKQLPKDYNVVLLKNEYGDVEGTPYTFSVKTTR